MSAKDLIKKHEGFDSFAYKCTSGKWTIGYGRNIDRAGGRGISAIEAEYLLDNDLSQITTELTKTFDWFAGLGHIRKAAIIDMAYQLGMAGFKGFKQTIALLSIGNFEKASEQMLLSKWAKQTPERAKDISSIIRTGKF